MRLRGRVLPTPRRWRGHRAVRAALVAAMLVAGYLVAISVSPASAATVDPNAWYVLVNRNSGKALDVYGSGTNDGARITQWSRHDQANQQWQFVDSGDGYYRIRSRHSSKVLDVSGRSTADGAAIVQWSDNSGTNQQFRLADSDGGYVRLINRNSNKAIQIQGAATTDGANAVQGTDSSAAHQQWQLVRVGGTDPTTPPPTTPPPTTPPPTTPPPSTFTNPVVWQDFADGDIIRVGDAYYYSASTMHYSPGAPILRSYDLVNWEYAGHSVPRLDFDSTAYDLTGGRAYVKGIWASAFNYRPSNSTLLLAGLHRVQPHLRLHRHLGRSGPGRRSPDQQLLLRRRPAVDDNDTMYVAYGNGTISVAQLSADGLSQVRAQRCSRPRRASARSRAPGSTSATATTTSG